MSKPEAPLPYVDEVTPLNSGDEACFAELRAILEKHGALQRFGVLLLHEHFKLRSDEVLVEECDTAQRTLTIRPIKRDTLSSEVLETSWRLDTAEPVDRCRTYCSRDSGRHRDVHRR